jgi:tetratricopeptide (TPR) repeat protein
MDTSSERPDISAKDKSKVEKEIDDSVKGAEKSLKRGEYLDAAAKYQEAAKLAESIHDKRAPDFCLEEAKCHIKLGKEFNAGWAYKCAAVYSLAFKDYGNAIIFASKASEFFSRADSLYAVQWCYNLIGEAGEKMGDFELAKKNYGKSLEIEFSEEIEKRINNLAGLVPSLVVEQKFGKGAFNEREKVDASLTLKNETNVMVSDVKLMGENAKVLESVQSLNPGESKTFKYTLTAEEKIKPLFLWMSWKDGRGVVLKKDVKPPVLSVIPDVEIKPYLKDKLEVGRKSTFVVSLINNSGQKIKDIEIEISFPVEFKVFPVTGYSIDCVEPGEEKGFVFKILPTTLGKTIVKPHVSFFDASGKRFEKIIEHFVLGEPVGTPSKARVEDGIEKPVSKNDFERVKYTEKFKKYLESFVHPKDIDESYYVRLTKTLKSATRGYTLKDVDIDTVSSHVLEECRSFALVSEHTSENYALFMLSGESTASAYLLTVVISAEDDLVHVAFRLYSENEDELEDILEKISDISEYTIIAMSLAKEIQKIEVKETINIIDSIVQRSKIGEKTRKKDKNVDIKDSIVQRTEL